jgi:hypothetical protein
MWSAFRRKLLLLAVVASAVLAVPSVAAAASFLSRFHSVSTIGSAVPSAGPAKGDQNPYGVAVVPVTKGKLVAGDVLISNFNNGMNQQGTGSSIDELSPSGHLKVFAVVPRPTSTPAVGLTTALVALRSGYVVVGSLPAPGGDRTKAQGGALSILDSHGHVVRTIKGGDINGPWDMTAIDNGSSAVLFVTEVLNGTVAGKDKNVARGTVVRIKLRIHSGHVPTVTSNQVIARGFTERTDMAALVVGPTGVGIARDGTLYVADSVRWRIASVPHAATRTSALGGGGKTVAAGGPINDPLGLEITPNGDVLTVNGGDGNAVELKPNGHVVSTKELVPMGAGDLFGLATKPGGHGLYFVNDIGSGPASNTLQLLR